MKVAERWHVYEEKLKQMPRLGDEAKEPAFRSDTDLEKVFIRTPGVISALLSPGLKDALQVKQVRSLIVCGLSTSGCVLSTVRAATDEGFVVTVVEDACADRCRGCISCL
jgi:nicotinamidase-related amidase